jgi:hypothetical protein
MNSLGVFGEPKFARVPWWGSVGVWLCLCVATDIRLCFGEPH